MFFVLYNYCISIVFRFSLHSLNEGLIMPANANPNIFIDHIQAVLNREPGANRYFSNSASFDIRGLGKNAKKTISALYILEPPLTEKTFKKISAMLKKMDEDLQNSPGWKEFVMTLEDPSKEKEYLRDYRFHVIGHSKLQRGCSSLEKDPIKQNKTWGSVQVYQQINQYDNFTSLQSAWVEKIKVGLGGLNANSSPENMLYLIDAQRKKIPFVYLGKEQGNTAILAAAPDKDKNKVQQLLNFLDKTIYRHFCGKEEAKLGRWHTLKATTKGTTLWSSASYNALTGDALKSAILKDFLVELQACDTKEALILKADELKGGEKYDIIAKGQSFKSRFLCGRETSSVKAFNKMVEALETELDSQKP